jgi:hypothetical protein
LHTLFDAYAGGECTMSEGTVGLIIFVVLAVIAALLWHRFVATYTRALIGATATAVIGFQVAAYIHLGHLDPFFIIAAAASSAPAAAIAFLVGLPFRAHRKTNRVPAK